jgi:small conductance mechanosensitive channel
MKTNLDLQQFYDHTYSWLISYVPRFIIGMLILLGGLWLIRVLLNQLLQKMHAKEVDPTLKPFLMSMLAVALRVLLIIGVMEIVGIQTTLFATLVGTFGVAVGLALSGTLQNFAGGILILLLKPFLVGDQINTKGIEGVVTSIQIFYTILTTFDNLVVIVPNSQLSNQVITNMSRQVTRRLDISYQVPNNIDINQISGTITKALNDCELCLKTRAPRIGIGELLPDAYVLNISVWTNARGFTDSKLIIQGKLLQTIKDAGIKIPGM